MPVKKLMTRLPRRVLTALLTLLLAAALLGANLLVTELEQRRGWRRDLSFNAVTTAGEVTRAVLADLPYPVHVYALFSRGGEDAPLLALLDRYAALSDRFTWEQTDITLNPGLLSRFRAATAEDSIQNDSLVVSCEATGRFRVLTYDSFIGQSFDMELGTMTPSSLTYESALTGAVRYVTQDTVPRAMILQGHGELNQDSTGLLADLLDRNGYDVWYFTMNSSEAELRAGDLLTLLSPQRDLSPSELERITAFAEAGGSILFTCDFSDPLDTMPNYASLMRWYGFLPKDGIVIASSEEPATFYENNRMYLLPSMAWTEITAPMKANGTESLLLTGARGFAVPEEADAALATDAVLLSGSKAYLRRTDDSRMTLQPEEGAETGPFALALLARRITDGGAVTRAFVLGCSTLLTSEEVFAMTDAQEFIVRTAHFLLDTEPADLGIIAKTAIRPQLSVASAFPGTLAVFLLPMLVAGAALVVLGFRRKL